MLTLDNSTRAAAVRLIGLQVAVAAWVLLTALTSVWDTFHTAHQSAAVDEFVAEQGLTCTTEPHLVESVIVQRDGTFVVMAFADAIAQAEVGRAEMLRFCAA